MPKTKISEFSSTPASNTDIDSINIAEGCAPSGINDAIRELMAQLKDWQSGTSNDPYVVGSSGSLTLNQGTANGVPYLNGSKVVTSGSALTFDGTNLGVGTTSPSGASGTTFAINGGAGQTRIALKNTASGDTSTDGFQIALLSDGVNVVYQNRESGYQAWEGNGSELMRLTSTGLGIGTSSPSQKLHVSGGRTLAITGNENYSLGIGRESNTNAYYLGVHSTTNPNLLFSNNAGTTNMTLTYDGNLGLGVTPTNNTLGKTLQNGQAGAWTAETGSNRWWLGSNWYYNSGDKYINNGFATLYSQQNGTHIFFTAASGTAGNAITFTQAMTLDADGDLGIGTTSPAEKLHVLTGTTYAATFNTSVTSASSTRISLGSLTTAAGGTGGSAAIGGNTTHSATAQSSLTFYTHDGTNLNEVGRFDPSGNLLVGQTSLNQTVVGFSVTPSGIVSTALAASTSAQNVYHVYSTGAGAYRFYVGLGGTVNATNTTITAISDQRLKENIRDLDDGLNVVMALKPRKFDWKEGKGANIKNARGFIAQEFEQVLPDMIEEWLDPAPEGEEPYKAVNANLIPTLVKAMQEQQAIIESLKARLDAANL